MGLEVGFLIFMSAIIGGVFLFLIMIGIVAKLIQLHEVKLQKAVVNATTTLERQLALRDWRRFQARFYPDETTRRPY